MFLNETEGINLKYKFPENSSLLSSVIGVKKKLEVKDRVIKSIDFREYMQEVCESFCR